MPTRFEKCIFDNMGIKHISNAEKIKQYRERCRQNKTYYCGVCNFQGQSNYELNRHKRSHRHRDNMIELLEIVTIKL
jgi:hypothetical protein